MAVFDILVRRKPKFLSDDFRQFHYDIYNTTFNAF